jgi:acetolactate synthase-1/2/3 large subunit
LEEIVPVNECAEAFLEMLNANGVDYIFLNPGTDTYPVQEALCKYQALGKHTPQVILCLHESVGMAAAHGYFMVSRKPQVVFVHVDVGTQQIGGALHNAQRGRIGVLLCAGRMPANVQAGKRVGRTHFVQWLQEHRDQSGVVRGYVKWEYELRTCENIHYVVPRAFQMASQEPCSPVYLTIPVDILREKVESVHIPNVTRFAPASAPQADTALLDRAASVMIGAEKPLIITGYLGRHPNSVAALVELAEATGARVISTPIYMNFPTSHPLYAGTEAGPYISDADVVLVIDHDAPYVPDKGKPGPTAKVIHIDIDPLKRHLPMWGFPVDIFIQCDSGKALPVLSQIIRQKLTPERREVIQTRGQSMKDEHWRQREEQHRLALSRATQTPISTEWLCHCVAEAIDDDTIVLMEPMNDNSPVLRQIPRSKPGTFFQSGGASLGWSLGAALGARLASPDKTVVAIVGDGSFVFGCPTAALWAAGAYHAPFLCIILNNQQYNAPRRAIMRNYGGTSYSEKTGQWVGVDILPSPDYALIARACRAYGQVVTDPSQIGTALKNALDQVHSGKAAVLDVRIER